MNVFNFGGAGYIETFEGIKYQLKLNSGINHIIVKMEANNIPFMIKRLSESIKKPVFDREEIIKMLNEENVPEDKILKIWAKMTGGEYLGKSKIKGVK